MVQDIEIYFTPYYRDVSSLLRPNFAILNLELHPEQVSQRQVLILSTVKMCLVSCHILETMQVSIIHTYQAA